MDEVVVPLRLLKQWVAQSFENDVQSRAVVGAFLEGQERNAAGARMYVELIELKKPQALKMTALGTNDSTKRWSRRPAYRTHSKSG